MKTIRVNNQQRQLSLRDIILDVLGISVEKYYQLQFATAEAFMAEKTLGDQIVLSEFLKEPAFWSWWRNQYMLVDEYFALMHTEIKGDDKLAAYRRMHIAIDVYPDSILWKKVDDSYMRTIDKIIKSKVK